MPGPTKAILTPADGSTPLKFHYNPDSVTLTKSASWNSSGPPVVSGTTTPEFTGTNARQLTMSGVVFDGWGDHTPVTESVNLLLSWTNATKDADKKGTPQPPVLTLEWGPEPYLKGYLKRVVARMTLFDTAGMPLRASVDITMVEVPDKVKTQNQNPTSGGIVGQSAATLHAGDTLANLAHREWGKPGLWRALAIANGIDDPMRVEPGRRLLVPTRAEAQRLAAAPNGGQEARHG